MDASKRAAIARLIADNARPMTRRRRREPLQIKICGNNNQVTASIVIVQSPGKADGHLPE